MNLQKKLNAVMKAAAKIEKKGFNSFGNYKYVRAVDVFEEIHKLLDANNINLSITELEFAREQWGKNFHSTIKCRATFTNTDDPKDFKEVDYYTVSSDTLDKDIFKAKTNGLKYLFTQQFLIITDDVVDTEQEKPERKEPVPSKFPYRYKDVFGVCKVCKSNWLLLAKSGKTIYCAAKPKGECDSGWINYNPDVHKKLTQEDIEKGIDYNLQEQIGEPKEVTEDLEF